MRAIGIPLVAMLVFVSLACGTEERAPFVYAQPDDTGGDAGEGGSGNEEDGSGFAGQGESGSGRSGGSAGAGGEAGAAGTGGSGDSGSNGSDGDNLPAPCTTDCPTISWISFAGGSFQMGSDESEHADERPVHLVSVPPFGIMNTEVTASQYAACVDAGQCSEPQRGRGYWTNWRIEGDSSGPVPSRENHPINEVDWYQAREFCAWIDGRLPSEAEWEFAARGGGQDILYPWGNYPATPDVAAMAPDNADKGMTTNVCAKTRGKTEQGLCDMAGNVSEWVEDDYHYNYGDSEGSRAPGDGSSWIDSPRGATRVVRGGGFENRADMLRTASRDGAEASVYDTNRGFRCAR